METNGPLLPLGEARTASRAAVIRSPLARVRADPARLERITVCTRPFRAAGPRVEPERVGDKLVVHNYGHGGAGWSLSWGSAAEVVRFATEHGARTVGVAGAGALGLTAAITLQRAGVKVKIYARELPPKVRSSRATGLWSPDSRVACAAGVEAGFGQRWETMARVSWARFGELLTLPGRPVAMHGRYVLSELPPDEALAARHREDPIGFAHLKARIEDLHEPPVDCAPGEHAFSVGLPSAWSRCQTTLRFDITALSEHLLGEFRERGGELRQAEFATPAELAALPEDLVVNCTGWGARTLFADASLTPVRGQIGWLPAQPEVDYSLQWERLSMVSRPDGVVVQRGASSDGTGWNDASEQPDHAEAEQAVRWLAELQGWGGV